MGYLSLVPYSLIFPNIYLCPHFMLWIIIWYYFISQTVLVLLAFWIFFSWLLCFFLKSKEFIQYFIITLNIQDCWTNNNGHLYPLPRISSTIFYYFTISADFLQYVCIIFFLFNYYVVIYRNLTRNTSGFNS